jgi:hypothetical protein
MAEIVHRAGQMTVRDKVSRPGGSPDGPHHGMLHGRGQPGYETAKLVKRASNNVLNITEVHLNMGHESSLTRAVEVTMLL